MSGRLLSAQFAWNGPELEVLYCGHLADPRLASSTGVPNCTRKPGIAQVLARFRPPEGFGSTASLLWHSSRVTSMRDPVLAR
jgi:hypothetical protein